MACFEWFMKIGDPNKGSFRLEGYKNVDTIGHSCRVMYTRKGH